MMGALCSRQRCAEGEARSGDGDEATANER
jgi:hypothetical protein